MSLRAKFWGVRGSYPVSSKSVLKYGGHTSCTEVLVDGADFNIILDAGTGLPELGRKLLEGPCGEGRGTVHLFLSHLHWDHVQGLPLFAPAYVAGNRLVVYGRQTMGSMLKDAVLGSMRPELFPLRLHKSPAKIEFVEVNPNEAITLEGIRCMPLRLNHPFGSTGFRLDLDGRSVAYVTDTSPFTDILYPDHFVAGVPKQVPEEDRAELNRMREDLVRGLEGCDAVIYDTQYTAEEYARTPHYGHGTHSHALEIMRDAGARKLVLYHHAPGRSDEGLDKQLSDAQDEGRPNGIEVDAARQGTEMPI